MFLIHDALSMIRAIRAQGGMIRIWGFLLNVPQIAGGIAFFYTIEGLIVGVAALLTLIIAGQIHRREPFSRLTGLCHIPWLVMLPWLVWRLAQFEHGAFQSGWMTFVATTIFVSLFFDVRDVFMHLRGAKTFDWAK